MVASLKSSGTASAIQMVSNRWCKHFTRSGLAYLKISGARPSAPSALPFFNALIAVFTSSSWIGAASASSVGYCGISSNTALSTIEVLFQTCSKCSAQRCTITDGSVNRVFPLASFTAVVIEGPNVMSIGRLLQPPSPVTPPVSFHLSNFKLCSWLRLVVPVTLRRRFPRTVSAPFRVTACSTFHSASMSPEASFNSILRAWSSEEISWHSSERSSSFINFETSSRDALVDALRTFCGICNSVFTFTSWWSDQVVVWRIARVRGTSSGPAAAQWRNLGDANG